MSSITYQVSWQRRIRSHPGHPGRSFGGEDNDESVVESEKSEGRRFPRSNYSFSVVSSQLYLPSFQNPYPLTKAVVPRNFNIASVSLSNRFNLLFEKFSISIQR